MGNMKTDSLRCQIRLGKSHSYVTFFNLVNLTKVFCNTQQIIKFKFIHKISLVANAFHFICNFWTKILSFLLNGFSLAITRAHKGDVKAFSLKANHQA